MPYETFEDRQRQREIKDFLIRKGVIAEPVVELKFGHNMDYAVLGEMIGSSPEVVELFSIALEAKWLFNLTWKQPDTHGVFLSLDKMLWAAAVKRGGELPCKLAARLADDNVAFGDIDDWDRGVGIVWVHRADRGKGGPHVVVPWRKLNLIGNMKEPAPAPVADDDDIWF